MWNMDGGMRTDRLMEKVVKSILEEKIAEGLIGKDHFDLVVSKYRVSRSIKWWRDHVKNKSKKCA